MKRLFLIAFGFVITSNTLIAQVKSGITSLTFNGYARAMTVGDDKDEIDLRFVGSTSTRIGDSLLSDMILTYSEQEIGKFLGHDLLPVSRVRSKNTPDDLNGSLFVMETITEKKAFKELDYDEVITIQCSINRNSSKTVKGNKMYEPIITLNIRITGRDGEKIYKKSESLKLKDQWIAAALIEEKQADGKFDVSLKNLKTVTVDTGGSDMAKGVSAVELLDWYKQVLGNALIR